MNAADLLSHLESLGIHVVAADGMLRVNAARGQLTEELKTAIAARKPELLTLLAERSGRPIPVPRISRDGPLPLSFFQERLWVLNRLEPGDTAYNMVVAWPSIRPVQPSKVVDAIGTIVRRHEILRASFREDAGVPSVVLLPPEAIPVAVRDLGHLPEEAQDEEIRAAALEAVHTPFDLSAEPVVRFAVYRVAGDRVVTLLAAHHIAVDAWSIGLLGRELAALCEGSAVAPPAPSLQYADFAAWQRGTQDPKTIASELGWWKQRLAGIPPLSTFPPDRQRPPDATGAARPFRLSRELSDGIRAMAREEGATVYMALVGACAAVLRWYTGQDDIVLGSPMGVRERPELETVVGPFVNVLVLRLDLSDDPSFAELLRRARTAVLDAHAHRGVPFEKLVEHLNPARSLQHPPLFQVAVVQHNVPDDGGAAIGSGGALFELTWFVREEGGELTGALEYRSSLYSEEFIDRVASRLEAVLAAAVADRRRRLSETSLLAPDERQQVLERFNATERPTDPATFAAQFERQASASPDACAVEFEGARLGYRELNRRANQVARHLRSLGIAPGVVVGLCMPRSLDLLAALLGIQKAGGAYLPLDPDFPAERLSFMLADGGAGALIASSPLPSGLRVPPGLPVVDLSTSHAAIAAQPGDDLEGGAGPLDLAYLIYTSGSTGRPKGVRIPQGALSNFLASMRDEPGLRPSDVVAAVTTLSFDIAALELYLPLTVGARVLLVPKATAANGRALADALNRSGATVLQATPATWRLLVEAGWRGPPGFRALCGGEPMSRELADAILERAAELWNLYGPTETTVWSTAGRVEAGAGPILIGRPIANTRIYVLGPGGQPVAPGVPGEIWIGGAGVAEGYHGRADLTSERFLPDRFHGAAGARMYRTGDLGRWHADGRLEHLGRVDHQVKVRGFRIELGEIESVLAAHPAVRHAVVVAREAAPGDVRLVAYVVFQPGEDLTVSEVRRHLRTQLPDYMVPSLVVTLEAIPLTPNGKLDRAALPDPFAAARPSAARVPPEPGVEQVLADIWREILHVDGVGAEDNFFELGGHSLLSLRVAAMVEKRLGWRMDPRALFFQTLRQVAAGAAAHARAGGAGG